MKKAHNYNRIPSMSMISKLKDKAKRALLSSQKYVKIDMVYLAKGGFWISLHFFLSAIISTISVAAFAYFIPKETYGTYKYLLSLASSISFLTLSGANQAVTLMAAKGSESILDYSIVAQLKWSTLFAIGAFGMGGYYLINDNTVFAISMFILGISFPISAAFNTYGAYLTGKREIKTVSIYSILATFFAGAVTITTIVITNNLLIIVSSYALASFLPSIYFYLIARPKHEKITSEDKKEFFNFSGHLSIVNIFQVISNNIDKILIFQFLGPSQLAIYSLALVMPERIRGLLKSGGSMIVPQLTQRKLSEIKNGFYMKIFWSILTGLVISLAYIIVAPIAFKFILPKYLESVIFSQALSLSLIFVIPTIYMGAIYRAKKMIKTIYYSNALTNIPKIVILLLFGKIWEIWGVVATILIMAAFDFVYNFFLLNTKLREAEFGV